MIWVILLALFIVALPELALIVFAGWCAAMDIRDSERREAGE